ncbi:MAG: WD40 repeat domain-containing protein, partial [Candidatus Kapaibacteriota bacterium]
EIKLKSLGVTSNSSYLPPQSALVLLRFEPSYIVFKNKQLDIKHDTTIRVTAINGDFSIVNIVSSNLNYDINPKVFNLSNGQSIDLVISYTPKDSVYNYTEFEFQSSLCTSEFYCFGTYSKYKNKPQKLKLTHPNGGEIFGVGFDTVITWEGIPQEESVKLEYSIDSGKTWNYLDTARGNSYKWLKIKRPTSQRCLVKVSMNKGSIKFSKKFSNPELSFLDGIPLWGRESIIAFVDKNRINLLSFPTFKFLNSINFDSNSILALIFHPTESVIAISLNNGKINFWNFATNKILKEYNTPNVNLLRFSPSGKYLVGSGNNFFRIWDIDFDTLIYTGFSKAVITAIDIKDNGLVAVGDNEGKISILDTKNHQKLNEMSDAKEAIHYLCFHSEGRALASVGSISGFKLRDYGTNTVYRHFKFLGTPSPNLNWYTFLRNGKIYIYSIASGRLSDSIPTGDVTGYVFSPSSELIATIYRSNQLKIWSLSGSCLYTISGKSKEINCF